MMTTLSGTASAAAASAPERKPLRATAYYATLSIVARQVDGARVNVTQVDGTPVPGLPVKFTISGDRSYLCEAVTDPNGNAECRQAPMPIGLPLTYLLLNGYDATFDGNAHYTPVTAHNTVGAR